MWTKFQQRFYQKNVIFLQSLCSSILLVFVALLTTSCASSGGSSNSRDDAILQITNNTSNIILYLYGSLSSERSWGPDQLGGDVIGIGRQFLLLGIKCGKSHDFKATTVRGSYYLYDVTFECGKAYYWNISDSNYKRENEIQKSKTPIIEKKFDYKL